jgi:coenzyme F420-reducing hydrogenase alpha subunit
VYLLHAPDFLGYPSALAMAADHRSVVEQGLAIKRVGNQLIAALGGRPVHPISVRVGGFSRVPRRSELDGIRRALDTTVEQARETVRLVATWDPPALEPQPLVAMRHPPSIRTTTAGSCPPTDGLAPGAWGRRSRSSTSRAPTRCTPAPTTAGVPAGPDRPHRACRRPAAPLASEALARPGSGRDPVNIHRSIVARAVELLHACAEARDLIDGYRPPGEPRAAFTPRPGVAAWSTEAPRGLLHHRYEVDEQGHVSHAQIVPPTSQNQGAIEADLAAFAPSVLDLPHAEATRRLEMLIRAYDPCISCATHFLDLSIVDAGAEEGTG